LLGSTPELQFIKGTGYDERYSDSKANFNDAAAAMLMMNK
jgi:hypothetical protein